ncbi:DUF4296 domain-containing protein [Faecalibacter bovis]|uniref:DUF4296 domain-containing protein n=1 Tax=Faecalibacter bovis TaxID=2898187 RepID=A0ABX7XF32_9FLAO|nr:DUF4296 domain-containing protein [Faecalibacter bovis]MBS7333445.1 DUF4296 domain-containing protein [Weeksellaceae bacterium]QTV06531.1 DUF4296 domain-containing protein [Faecalibacter bovis]
MKKIAYIFIILISIVSCSKPYAQKPDDLLSKSEMRDILVDIYTSQQMMNSIQSQSPNQVLDVAKNTMYIFDQHETTHKIFEDSYKYYYTQTGAYQKILDDVIDELKNRLSEEELKKYEEIQAQGQQPQ